MAVGSPPSTPSGVPACGAAAAARDDGPGVLVAGIAAAQLCGTESRPIDAARPRFAAIVAPPELADRSPVALAPSPAANVEPPVVAACSTACAAGVSIRMIPVNELVIEANPLLSVIEPSM